MTNSIIEIPDSRNVAVAVASNTALCMTLCTVVGQRLPTLPCHSTFAEPQDFWQRNAKKQTNNLLGENI